MADVAYLRAHPGISLPVPGARIMTDLEMATTPAQSRVWPEPPVKTTNERIALLDLLKQHTTLTSAILRAEGFNTQQACSRLGILTDWAEFGLVRMVRSDKVSNSFTITDRGMAWNPLPFDRFVTWTDDEVLDAITAINAMPRAAGHPIPPPRCPGRPATVNSILHHLERGRGDRKVSDRMRLTLLELVRQGRIASAPPDTGKGQVPYWIPKGGA